MHPLPFGNEWWIFQRRGTPRRRHTPLGIVVVGTLHFLLGYTAPLVILGLAAIGVPAELATLLAFGVTLGYSIARWAVDGQGLRTAAWVAGAGFIPMQAVVTAPNVDAFTRMVYNLWLLVGPGLALAILVKELWDWYRRDPLEAFSLKPADQGARGSDRQAPDRIRT